MNLLFINDAFMFVFFFFRDKEEESRSFNLKYTS